MKTITIDPKSFCLGVLAMGAVLLMANKPASQPVVQPQPDNGRYQAVVGRETRTIIIDTKTGRFLVERPGVGLPGWAAEDFEELMQKRK
ncbi:hypothetical protein ACAW74_22080 [Fibrella sp. WM1]|uniref:hypothetical protein n=1 Tax=Fibrella musci TaxID=3242485 RepID=UPI0035218245